MPQGDALDPGQENAGVRHHRERNGQAQHLRRLLGKRRDGRAERQARNEEENSQEDVGSQEKGAERDGGGRGPGEKEEENNARPPRNPARGRRTKPRRGRRPRTALCASGPRTLRSRRTRGSSLRWEGKAPCTRHEERSRTASAYEQVDDHEHPYEHTAPSDSPGRRGAFPLAANGRPRPPGATPRRPPSPRCADSTASWVAHPPRSRSTRPQRTRTSRLRDRTLCRNGGHRRVPGRTRSCPTPRS